MGSLLFWMATPPDPEMPLRTWQSFLDTMATWMLVAIVGGVVVMTLLYTWHARAKPIRRAQDVFAVYTPLRWLAVAVLPAIAVFFAYVVEFRTSFPGPARASEFSGGTLAVIAALITLLLGYAAMWMPLVTPRKYRYRPRALFLGVSSRKQALPKR